MSIRRVYDPPECDAAGVPLDWERCRTCEGVGRRRRAIPGVPVQVCVADEPCAVCGGRGSLKAAALREKAPVWNWATGRALVARCESCSHPMSEGTWEPDPAFTSVGDRESFLARVAAGGCVYDTFVHYSPCDEGCTHYSIVFDGNYPVDPLVRLVRPVPEGTDTDVQVGALIGDGYGPFEASWRPVEIRTLGWPHDLRPEKLAVLCLRCYAAR